DLRIWSRRANRFLNQPGLRARKLAAARTEYDPQDFGAHRAPLQFRRAQRTIAHEGRLRRLRGPIQPARNRIDEVGYVFGDDRLRSSNLLATQRERLLRDRLQRIDVVKINAIQLVYCRGHIAWHGY